MNKAMKKFLLSGAFISLVLIIVCTSCVSNPPGPMPSKERLLADNAVLRAEKFSKNQQWQEAVLAWSTAAEQLELLDDIAAKAIAEHNCGYALMKLQKYNDAEKRFEKSVSLCRNAGLTNQWLYSEIALAQVRRMTGRTKEALEMLQGIRLNAGASKDSNLKTTFLIEYGICLNEAGDANLGLQTLADALKTLEKSNDYYSIGCAFAGRASVWETIGDYNQAINDWKKALEYFKRVGDLPSIAQAMASQGRLIIKARGDSNAASRLLNQARKIYLKLNMEDHAKSLDESIDQLKEH
jgi:tetratricopeptide (TPR) repeat protein